MRIAYVRVSTAEQNEQRQIDALAKHDIERWFTEKVSGKDTNRPQLQAMLEFAREGDTIYVHDFSRLARSTADLLKIVELLQRKKIHLVSNKENIDTSTPTGKLMHLYAGYIGYRTPKRNLLNKIAHALNASNGLLSPEADVTLQTLLCHLLWLDQADTNLIDLIPLDDANFPPPCNSPDKGRIAIVINDTAFQDILTYWHTEKSLLAAGAITQDGYFGWKLNQHL